MDGLTQLVKVDSDWVSAEDGCALYIRPFVFATDEALGVKQSETYRFIIFTAPVGPYFTEPIKVLIETKAPFPWGKRGLLIAK